MEKKNNFVVLPVSLAKGKKKGGERGEVKMQQRDKSCKKRRLRKQQQAKEEGEGKRGRGGKINSSFETGLKVRKENKTTRFFFQHRFLHH